MKNSTIKAFFFILFLLNFICNAVFAEKICKKWDLPDSGE